MPHRRVGDEVSLQCLATGNRDSGGRKRRKRENRPGFLVCALHQHALFSQLPVRTRDRKLRCPRGARAHLRQARSCHRRLDSSDPGCDPRSTRRSGTSPPTSTMPVSTAASTSASTRREVLRRDVSGRVRLSPRLQAHAGLRLRRGGRQGRSPLDEQVKSCHLLHHGGKWRGV